MVTRRTFNKGLASLAFTGLLSHVSLAKAALSQFALADDKAYGRLIPDENGILDLPRGFSYQVLSTLSNTMTDGLKVPDRADGMGCLPLDDDRVVLVRNHEISVKHNSDASETVLKSMADSAYDRLDDGMPLQGGTSNIVYNLKTQKVEQEFMSLLGTVRNCAGGTTPWGSWLTCEESVVKQGQSVNADHGYIFEVPATATGLVEPIPLKAMGRFNHEAACVDPSTGIVYLTEDRSDSLFYRFIPTVKGELHKGGVLQALVVSSNPSFDTRNWDTNAMELHKEFPCQWITLDNVEAPQDDLRARGYANGAAIFARGEGIHFDNGEMYFCCTSGGKAKLGQIMRYKPSANEGTDSERNQPGYLSLFLESPDKVTFNYGDNIVIAPNQHLVVCEDQYSDVVNNHIKGVTPNGQTYNIGKVLWQTEPAGVCFSPDGKTLFVNLYSPTCTLAITGPWETFNA